MKNNKKILKKYIIYVLAVLTIIALFLSVKFGVLKSFQAVFGGFLILVVPGYCLSLYFWNDDKISIFERAMVSVFLSIIIIPLTLLLINKIGIPINTISILITILVASGIGIITNIIKKRIRI